MYANPLSATGNKSANLTSTTGLFLLVIIVNIASPNIALFGVAMPGFVASPLSPEGVGKVSDAAVLKDENCVLDLGNPIPTNH